MIKVAVIGYGYWGHNIVRNFQTTPEIQIVAICDQNRENLKKAQKLYPQVKLSTHYREVIDSPESDVIAVVTPVNTHYELSKLVLKAGKHLFVEKPFTDNSKHAEELIELAEKKNLIIMVDHTFLFTAAVRKIKELIEDGTLGDLYYYDATRVNLGLFRQDVNVIWDLAPHDFSIMNHLISKKPNALAAHGMDHCGDGLYNTAYITLYFDNLIAHFNFNWLSPVKIRTTYLGGQKKMIVWDDLESDEKVKVYNKGISIEDSDERNLVHRINYRLGDVWIPQLEPKEALSTEAEYFAECIKDGKKPLNDGHSGLKVIQLLEAADLSIRQKGKLIHL